VEEVEAVSLRTTLVLMFVFMGLGSFTLFDPFGLKEKRTEKAEGAKRTLALKGAKFSTLSVKHGLLEVRFRCTKAEGCDFDGSALARVEAPVVDDADSSNLGSLLSAIAAMEHSDKFSLEGSMTPGEFGLLPGAASLELVLVGKDEPLKLVFGGSTPVGPNRYFESSAQPGQVFVVPGYIADMAKKDLFHWRNKRIFPGVEGENVKRLAWQGSNLSLVAEEADNVWRIKEPLAVQANSIQIEGLVTTASSLAAKSLFSENHSSVEARKILSQRPALRIQFTHGEQKEELRLFSQNAKAGATANELIAAAGSGGPLYVVDGVPFSRFQKPLREYRERRIISERDEDSVETVAIEFLKTKEKILLKKNGADWTVEGEALPEKLSQRRLQGLHGVLFNTDVDDFVTGVLSKEMADLELVINGASLPESRLLFRVAGKKVLTQGERKGELRQLPESFLKELPLRLEDLYEKNNLAPPVESKEPHGHHHSHGDHQH
jgi:hypothetical protein